MRMHIMVDDDLVGRIDAVAGERGRSGWIVKVIRERLEVEERWKGILDGIGCLADTGHEWDEDPAAWVRAQRGDPVPAPPPYDVPRGDAVEAESAAEPVTQPASG